MKQLMALGMLVGLAACGPSQQQAEAGKAACAAQFPAQIGNYVRRQQCFINAIAAAGFKGADQDLLDAERINLARKVDHSEITPDEANARFAHIAYEVRRQADADRAQRAVAAAAILSAMPRPQPYVVPTPYAAPMMPYTPSRQPWSASCMNLGSITTCNGN